jgi:hypothetical protein
MNIAVKGDCIVSDRKLVERCSLRLDLLYFLGYQLDEPLPWHGTISRIRQLSPEALFNQVFTYVLALCPETGIVAGHNLCARTLCVKK